MTDEELERMRAYAQAAREHPTWSVAYAQDVPKLLAQIAAVEKISRNVDDQRGKLWHRLRFAEMVLDRVNAEIDGVPWREAARLSESVDGEPVTDAEPLDKRQRQMEHEASHLVETCLWYAEDFAGPEAEWRHFVGVEVPDQVLRIIAAPVAPSLDTGVQS